MRSLFRAFAIALRDRFSYNHRMKWRSVFCAAAFALLVLFSGCEMLGLLPRGTMVFRVIPSYVEMVDGEYPAQLEYEVSAIIEVTPAIHGQSVFVSDADGWFVINDVPEGEYNIHPVFLDESYDVQVTVTRDSEAQPDPYIFPAEIGLYFYSANKSGNAYANPDLDATALTGLSKSINRVQLLSIIGITDQEPAYTLLPPAVRNDGLETVTSVTEDATWANDNITASSPFDIQLSHNIGDTHAAIADELKTTFEALNAVNQVTVNAVEWQQFLTLRENLEGEIFRHGWLLDSNNMLVYFKFLIETSGIMDATLNAAVTDAQSALDTGDLAIHAEKLAEIHDILLNSGAIIPLYYYD